jgi:hypothetical protein
MSASTGTDAGHGGVANRNPEEQAMTDGHQWFAFIDWASQKHQICLLDAAGQLCGERDFAHSGAGLAELCDWLLAKTGAPPSAIAVGIEVSHGPVVETLLERGFAVHALNPKQLDRFRDRFSVAGPGAAAPRRHGPDNGRPHWAAPTPHVRGAPMRAPVPPGASSEQDQSDPSTPCPASACRRTRCGGTAPTRSRQRAATFEPPLRRLV